MRDWKTRRVDELTRQNILVVGDGYRAKNVELSHEGLPFARGANINQGFHLKDAECLDSANLHRAGEKISRPGDVVFTSKGSVGRFAFVNESTPKFVYSPQLCYWRVLNTDVIDPRFLYFWMHGREFLEQANGVKGQTDMADYVSLVNQRRFHVTLPPIEEQKAIARILSSLDDKIEVNRRMNATLEAMARALFKAWFVDFEPVHANREGRPSTSAPPEIAKLFPSDFQNTIPKGWREERLTEFFDLIGGGTPKTSISEYWSGKIPWYAVVDAPNETDVFVIDTEKKITPVGLENSSTKLLRRGVTIISARGTVGKLAITGSEMTMNQSCYATQGKFGDYFNYYIVKAAITELKQKTHGAVFDTITQDTFKSVRQILPTKETISAFEHNVSPIMRKIEQNLRENKTLAELRNSLLPRLINGRIPLVNTL